MAIEEVIENFKNLNLSTYPESDIRSIFKEVGKIIHIVVKFHKGKSVMRARPNYNGERFTKMSDFSFKPSKYNNTFQRASTPMQTMFYATSIPDIIEKGELDNMRVIGVAETIPLLREKDKSGYQKISFGRWYVKEDLNLIAIVHEKRYQEQSNYTRELVEAYSSFIENFSLEIKSRSLKFHSFLAEEFSKEEINGDFDYMISAIFTDMVVKQGFDGVLYPSVRVGGKGFNIAITPEATKKIELLAAGECSLYKLKDQTIVGNDAFIKLNGSEETFELIEMENHEKECLAELGVTSVNELV
jgi:hypothetical protein